MPFSASLKSFHRVYRKHSLTCAPPQEELQLACALCESFVQGTLPCSIIRSPSPVDSATASHLTFRHHKDDTWI
jgi:hypothetical protein